MRAEALRQEVSRLTTLRTDARLGLDPMHTYDDELMRWWETTKPRIVSRPVNERAAAAVAVEVVDQTIANDPAIEEELVYAILDQKLGGVR